VKITELIQRLDEIERECGDIEVLANQQDGTVQPVGDLDIIRLARRGEAKAVLIY